MARRSTVSLSVVFALLTAVASEAQNGLNANDAKKHIREQATVCGKVVSTRYAENSRGRPTFLNLDEAYPNQIFTILIWGSDRSKFDEPETAFRGKRVCVSGKISDFKGVPEVVASDRSQIKLVQ